MESRAGLVTGAAGGIGRATAVALGREGATVVVNDL
jgi:NAD(P)-dependent dehydrogenase (short-subunit alcohol dehydrogenase family)